MNLNSIFKRFVLAGCLAAVGVSVHARDIDDLYQADVAVADRSAAELKRGAGAALALVLVKLTGDRRIGSSDSVAPLLARAGKLMLQYSYAQNSETGVIYLTAEFDAPALVAEMDRIGVPVWGKERPEVLVWLVVDDEQARQVVSGDEPGLFGEGARARAALRGIPLLFPIMDIEESQHLQFQGDWDGLATTTVALSARYRAPVVAVAHMRAAGSGYWEAEWSVYLDGEALSWRQEETLPLLMVDEGIDRVADAVADRFTRQAGSAPTESISVTITGIRSAADYARLAGYLDGLDTVETMQVRSVAGDSATFALESRGGQVALAQSIVFGQVLVPVDMERNVYRLQP